MSEKRLEEEKTENCEYDYSLLDTYYECRDGKIIEWNKHSSNAEYDNFESITRILNVKEMRLESCQKGELRMSDLLKENEQLKKELDEFKEVIIDKVQYGEDNLENFLIQKGIIKEDWARFDGYD